jgi:hypothetical protein
MTVSWMNRPTKPPSLGVVRPFVLGRLFEGSEAEQVGSHVSQ